MGRLEKGLKTILGGNPAKNDQQNVVTVGSGRIAGVSVSGYLSAEEQTAMKLSAADRCVEVLSDSIGKLPIYIIDTKTKKRVEAHALLPLLTLRPNGVQSRTVMMKMLECNRVCGGNGYAYIVRDRYL